MNLFSYQILASLAFVLCFASVTWSQNETTGYLLGRAGSRALHTNENICATKFGPRCGSDCFTLLTCAHTIIHSQTCSSINRNTPYCVNHACSSKPGEQCVLPFTCTGTGLFPDPSDCKRYYLCEGPAGSALTFQCPTGFTYESRSGLCKRLRYSSDCQTIDCSRSPNRYVTFAGDRSIIAFCQGDDKKQPILYRCLDNANMEYNLETLSCTYKCTSEGRFADKLDCSKFYDCYRNGNVYDSYHGSCPSGFSYNAIRKTCSRQATCQSEIAEDIMVTGPPSTEDES